MYKRQVSFSDVPLSIFYLSFYCNNRTRFLVSAKILFLGIEKNLHHWAKYIEQYIYKEEPATDLNSNRERIETFNYDSSKFWNVCFHQIGFIFLSPFLGKLYLSIFVNYVLIIWYVLLKMYSFYVLYLLGIAEIANAFKLSLNRDFGWFGNKNKIYLVKSTSDQIQPDKD